jgi:hypothetical protein
VIFAAVGWELTVSGVTMTNRNSRALPRHARVMLFCGYVTLVATSVLFFSSLHVQATGTRLAPIFESEAWAQQGIVLLAVPLLICLWILRLAGPAHHASPEPPEGIPEPALAITAVSEPVGEPV